MREFVCVGIAISALLVGACSDDTKLTKSDTKTVKLDKGVEADTAALPDAAPGKEAGKPDAPPVKLDTTPGKVDTTVAKVDKGAQADMHALPEASPGKDAGKDAGKPDGPPGQCTSAVIGKVCTQSGGECGAAGSCLLTSATAGVCGCTCTADDPQTSLVNEDSCPDLAKNICVPVPLTSGTTYNICMRKCAPKLGANDCEAGVSCEPLSAAQFDIESPVCIFAGCAANSDCQVNTGVKCTIATPTACKAAEKCLPEKTGDTEGLCIAAGVCDTTSGLCDKHTLGKAGAKVGDPCKSDLDCDGQMMCFPETDRSTLKKGGQSCADSSECCSGVCGATKKCTTGLCTTLWRGGYCTILNCHYAKTFTLKACPTGSACANLWSSGACMKACDMTKAGDCRGTATDLYGDYECRRWGNLVFGAAMIPGVDPDSSGKAPAVCDAGPNLSCDDLAASTMDCSVVGNDETGATNPTNMVCRKLDGTKTTSQTDPTGFCFDDTASGTQYRSPLPTP